MYKAVRPEDNENALAICRSLGLQVAAGWIMIDPLMRGLHEIRENVAFIERNALIPRSLSDDFVTSAISCMRVLEGSPLVDQMRKAELLGRKRSNLVEYDFRYADECVGDIAAAISAWTTGIAPTVYAAKNIVAVAALSRQQGESVVEIAGLVFTLKRLDFSLLLALLSVASSDARARRTAFAGVLTQFQQQRTPIISLLQPLVQTYRLAK